MPALAAFIVLLRLRTAAPDPALYDPASRTSDAKQLTVTTHLPARFWIYAAFSAATMLGFATWAVVAFHLTVRHVVGPGVVPVLYAVAMGAAAIASLVFGRIYDRMGLRGLVVLPVLAALAPILTFSQSVAGVTAGALVWGVAMGVHESTMRAAVTDLVPPERRGAGYGTFTAIYGLAWLAGAATIGLLYERSVPDVETFVIVVQALAVCLLLPLLRRPRTSG